MCPFKQHTQIKISDYMINAIKQPMCLFSVTENEILDIVHGCKVRSLTNQYHHKTKRKEHVDLLKSSLETYGDKLC